MHGLSGTGSQQRSSSMSGFDKVADKGKFVVVYPDGVYKLNTYAGWDISSNTDVDFISALIDTIAGRFNIDLNRVYASGFSMGGMMSYKLACTLSDKIAAIKVNRISIMFLVSISACSTLYIFDHCRAKAVPCQHVIIKGRDAQKLKAPSCSLGAFRFTQIVCKRALQVGLLCRYC
jgi:predicted peptidase